MQAFFLLTAISLPATATEAQRKENTEEECYKFVERCVDEKYARWRENECPHTCDDYVAAVAAEYVTSSSGGTTPCVDRIRDGRCDSWTRHGFCATHSQVRYNCCNFCREYGNVDGNIGTEDGENGIKEEECTFKKASPVALGFVFDSSNSLHPEAFQKQFRVAQSMHRAYVQYFLDTYGRADGKVWTSIEQFSFRNETLRNMTDNIHVFDDLWREFGHTWKQQKSITYYHDALHECYRILDEDLPPEIRAQKPLRQCILLTDGLPQDCGGTEDMHPKGNEMGKLIRPMSVNACLPGSDSGIEVQTLFLAQKKPKSEDIHTDRLSLLSKLSSCDKARTVPLGDGVIVEGLFNDDRVCPYLRAAISLTAYEWMDNHVKTIVSHILPPSCKKTEVIRG